MEGKDCTEKENEREMMRDKDGYELNTQHHFAAWSFCGA